MPRMYSYFGDTAPGARVFRKGVDLPSETFGSMRNGQRRFRTPDPTHSFVRFMEVIRTGTPALTPRRGRNKRRDEASSGHDFSTASGVVWLSEKDVPPGELHLGDTTLDCAP